MARDNKTIVRVERDEGGAIFGTTLFRPSTAKLSPDDKANLKLLNIYDPYVAEFFFGGNFVLVEGDTEYAAFKMVAARLLQEPDKSPIPVGLLRNLTVIRARGKATLVSLSKVLNHFGAAYSILHDTDTETITVTNRKTGVTKEQKNPAWAVNNSIVAEVDGAPDPNRIRIVGSLDTFERAYLDYSATSDKPVNAIAALAAPSEHRDVIIALLHALLDHNVKLPEGAVDTRDFLVEHATKAEQPAVA